MVSVQDQITLLSFLILNVCGSSYCYGSFSGEYEWTLHGLKGTGDGSSIVLGSRSRKMEGRLLAPAEEEIPEIHETWCECILCRRISHLRRIRFDFSWWNTEQRLEQLRRDKQRFCVEDEDSGSTGGDGS